MEQINILLDIEHVVMIIVFGVTNGDWDTQSVLNVVGTDDQFCIACGIEGFDG